MFTFMATTYDQETVLMSFSQKMFHNLEYLLNLLRIGYLTTE